MLDGFLRAAGEWLFHISLVLLVVVIIGFGVILHEFWEKHRANRKSK